MSIIKELVVLYWDVFCPNKSAQYHTLIASFYTPEEAFDRVIKNSEQWQ